MAPQEHTQVPCSQRDAVGTRAQLLEVVGRHKEARAWGGSGGRAARLRKGQGLGGDSCGDSHEGPSAHGQRLQDQACKRRQRREGSRVCGACGMWRQGRGLHTRLASAERGWAPAGGGPSLGPAATGSRQSEKRATAGHAPGRSNSWRAQARASAGRAAKWTPGLSTSGACAHRRPVGKAARLARGQLARDPCRVPAAPAHLRWC